MVPSNSSPGDCGASCRLDRIHDEPVGDRNNLEGLFRTEFPVCPARPGYHTFVRHTVMRAQVGGFLRHIPGFQISRAGTENPAEPSHAQSNHAAVGQFADAEREIHILLHQIHPPIIQQHAHANVRMGAQKFPDDGHDMDAPHNLRHADGQSPPGCQIFAGGTAFGSPYLQRKAEWPCLRDGP
jgi:hypothetical protein